MKYLCLATAVTLMALAQARAADTTIGAQANVADPDKLYIYLAGGSAITYPNSEFSQTIDQATAQGGRVNTVGIIEGGIFKKRSEQLWLGVMPALIAEEYSGNYQQTSSLSVTHWNANASAWWFLHRRESCGFHARADIGYSYIHVYNSLGGVTNDSYYNGANGKISLGYALPVFNNGDFWSFNVGAFGVAAGSYTETGIDLTVGIML